MTYGEAGEVLTRTVSEMRQTWGSAAVWDCCMLYQIRDQTGHRKQRTTVEAYFGALQHELQSQGRIHTRPRKHFSQA